MTIADQLAPPRIARVDGAAVENYNRRANDERRLRAELGPSAFEGAIDHAAIVLLLSNPGFDETSTVDDHQFQRNGWPLAGLHPDAPSGLREWWEGNLAALIALYGAQRVSQSVACLQLTPWASNGFDSVLRLPSRSLALQAADSCSARGALMLVMRSEDLWFEALGLASAPSTYIAHNRRRAYVTQGNLGDEAWAAIREVFR